MVPSFSSANAEYQANERAVNTFSIERRSSSCIESSSYERCHASRSQLRRKAQLPNNRDITQNGPAANPACSAALLDLSRFLIFGDTIAIPRPGFIVSKSSSPVIITSAFPLRDNFQELVVFEIAALTHDLNDRNEFGRGFQLF
jgi:hypothetical protein